MHVFILALCLLLTASCARKDLAPVSELTWHGNNREASNHKVRYGETLYSVAFLYDQDYQKLAKYNHLKSYALRENQILKLLPREKYKTRQFNTGKLRFNWPITGRVIKRFSVAKASKGINISGYKMEPVKASASGVVAYAGNGIPGYGQLILIKHNNQFLTAYGNNAVNLVKEGQQVKAGQVIGKVGYLDRQHSGLHFEIRRSGKPVNPLLYIQK
ncbi:MAG: hypothetical protein A3F18_02555 [Legionellales bacterium RIFCSPHIGHO2_12_FULL_37_14]|nr:MAG: hypothetical protein A3F18_02555 [Legionellales bacterium RIFCSPHIGHO2_12_FULL_37_14]